MALSRAVVKGGRQNMIAIIPDQERCLLVTLYTGIRYELKNPPGISLFPCTGDCCRKVSGRASTTLSGNDTWNSGRQMMGIAERVNINNGLNP
jgi:hypothetical protein